MTYVSQFSNSQASVTVDKQSIHKPPISVIMEKLGRCDSETINNYLRLDHKIDLFWETNINNAGWYQQNLTEITDILSVLRNSLDNEARRVNAVLAEPES
jgi:hypothetical protein